MYTTGSVAVRLPKYREAHSPQGFEPARTWPVFYPTGPKLYNNISNLNPILRRLLLAILCEQACRSEGFTPLGSALSGDADIGEGWDLVRVADIIADCSTICACCELPPRLRLHQLDANTRLDEQHNQRFKCL